MSERDQHPTKPSALVRYHPAFIAMGVLFFVISLWAMEGWRKLTALLWVALVISWAQQYRRWRRSTRG
ncbi:hypothetical protein [Kineococcus sp. SYSU DK006]|uniref:hypothetical protein n=1 Tax=Kineococcus sp. SYSU DK006 TaxID=3383127 RepID=UPI003D7E233E